MKVKVCSHSASLPQRKTEGAAAYDLFAAESKTIQPNSVNIVSTDLCMEIPEGWKGEVYSRSGLASRGLTVANQPGKIDSDYRGVVKVILRNSTPSSYEVSQGDRIAQFEVNPVYTIEWDEDLFLNSSVRGMKGLGSTGS